MVHCHMEHHMANGMMTLLAYDGYQPTGPAAAIIEQQGAMHVHAASPATPSPVPATPATAATSAAGAEVEVTMVDDRFDPVQLTVPAGTTVRWVNRGADWHSIAAMDGSFQADRIAPGASYAHRFTRPGTYPYICQHHGLQGMTGSVTVQAP
jgi:plastocyanin